MAYEEAVEVREAIGELTEAVKLLVEVQALSVLAGDRSFGRLGESTKATPHQQREARLRHIGRRLGKILIEVGPAWIDNGELRITSATATRRRRSLGRQGRRRGVGS